MGPQTNFLSLALAMLVGSASGLAMQWALLQGASYDEMQAQLDGGRGMAAQTYVAAVSAAIACAIFMGHSTLSKLQHLLAKKLQHHLPSQIKDLHCRSAKDMMNRRVLTSGHFV